MTDFYEVDFIPVHRRDSGDAISARYTIGGVAYVHVIDGGYESTTELIAKHLVAHYETTLIDFMVVTHPDQDHAEGLAGILENYDVGELWMLRPWVYSTYLLQYFARYNDAERLTQRLREDYPYIATLEEIAIRRGIPIMEPLQGAKIGLFTVLSPSLSRYITLIVESERTPQLSIRGRSLVAQIQEGVRKLAELISAGWGSENFSSEPTSLENEMSVVQYANLCGDGVLLTGDAGCDGMTEAADYFEKQMGLPLPGITKFQVPHHGGRRNLSSKILDRWVGPRLAQKLPEGQELFTAMISSAKEDPDHPRNAVLRALYHRGARILTTEEAHFRISKNALKRDGWGPAKVPSYPTTQEK